jgi:hypothetical protein
VTSFGGDAEGTMADNIVISPAGGGQGWTFAVRSDARRVLAVSARRYRRGQDCDAVIAELFNPYEFAMTVRQYRDGRWMWELSKAGRPLLVSPRVYSSLKSCGAAVRKAKRFIHDLARRPRTNQEPARHVVHWQQPLL